MPTSWSETTGTPAGRAARSHGVAAARDGSSITSSARSAWTSASRVAGSTSAPRRRAVSAAATVPRIETRGGTPRALARWMRADEVAEADAGAGGDAEEDLVAGAHAPSARRPAPVPAPVTPPVRAGR